MAIPDYIVAFQRFLSCRRRKFLQRFLAVVLASLFLSFVPGFFSPVPALDGDPNPPSYNEPVLQLVEKGLLITAEEAEADPLLIPLLDNPFVLVGATVVAVGVVWYFYSQAQQQAAQQLAQQKYCTANPNDSVCLPFTGGQLPILYDVFYSFHYQTGPYTGNLDNQPPGYRALQVYGPIRNFGAIRPVSLDYNNPTYDYILGLASSWGVYNRNGYGFCPLVIASDQKGNSANYQSFYGGCADAANPYDTTGDRSYPGTYYLSDISITPSQGQPDTGGNPPPMDWKDWPQNKRQAAVAMLNDDDWLSNLQQSPQGGVLQPGDQLPQGYCSFPSNGNPQCNFDPITIPDGNPNPIPTPTPSGPPEGTPPPIYPPTSPPPDPTPSPSPSDGSGPPTASGGGSSPDPTPTPSGGSQPSDDDIWRELDRLNNPTTEVSPEAQAIANGHAWNDHRLEFPEVHSQGEFAQLINGILNNASEEKQLSNGRTAYWDAQSTTVVIRDPGDADGGTAFRPTGGKDYFDNLK